MFLLIFYDNAWSSSRIARPAGVASAEPDAQPHVPACCSGLYYHPMHRTTNLRAHSGPQVADRRHVKTNTTNITIKKTIYAKNLKILGHTDTGDMGCALKPLADILEKRRCVQELYHTMYFWS